MLRAVCAIVAVALLVSCCYGTEENDLWLLLSSYMDLGITVKDLAFFLETHGYNAEPHEAKGPIGARNSKKLLCQK